MILLSKEKVLLSLYIIGKYKKSVHFVLYCEIKQIALKQESVLVFIARCLNGVFAFYWSLRSIRNVPKLGFQNHSML